MKEDDNEGLGHLRYRNKAQFIVSTGGIITKKRRTDRSCGRSIGRLLQSEKVILLLTVRTGALQSEAAVAAADASKAFYERRSYNGLG